MKIGKDDGRKIRNKLTRQLFMDDTKLYILCITPEISGGSQPLHSLVRRKRIPILSSAGLRWSQQFPRFRRPPSEANEVIRSSAARRR
jgi:hypothetical protein